MCVDIIFFLYLLEECVIERYRLYVGVRLWVIVVCFLNVLRGGYYRFYNMEKILWVYVVYYSFLRFYV